MDQRTRIGIFLLWFGAFMPIVASVSKTTDEVTSGVGPLEIVRGGGPLALYFLSILAAPHYGAKDKPRWTEVSLALFLIVAAASTFWSYNPWATALKCIPLIFSYLCMLRLAKLYPTPQAAISGVVAVAHILMASTLLQWVVIPNQAFTADVGDVIPRLGSVYPAISPNLLGVVALVALAGGVLQVGPKLTRSPGAVIVLGLTYTVMLFASRSRIATAIALAVVFGATLVAMHKTRARAAFGWFAAATGVVAAYVAAQKTTAVVDFTDFLIRGQDAHALTSLTGRTVIWDRALAIWNENPVVGFGYYSGHRLFLASVDPLFSHYSNLDSTWIETLVDLGYLGLVPLSIFSIAALLRVLRFHLPRSEKLVSVGLVGAVLALSFVNPTIQAASSTAVMFGVVVFSCRPDRRANHASLSQMSWAPRFGPPRNHSHA